MNVSFGATQSVVVEAEDNILPLIETNVRSSRLVINTKPNTSISPTRPIRVTVTMKSLSAASISGSGNLTINNLQVASLALELSGSGNLTATGETDSVKIMLDGSGNIECSNLQAKSAAVKVDGSGNVTVYASESLEARVGGSGNVKYGGNPPTVNKSVQGSGSVDSLP